MTSQLTALRNPSTPERGVLDIKAHLIGEEIDGAILDVWKKKVDNLEYKLRTKEKQVQSLTSDLESLSEEMKYLEEKNKLQARYLLEQNRQLIETEYVYSNQLKSPIDAISSLVHRLYESDHLEDIQQLVGLLEKNTRQLQERIKELSNSISRM